MNADALAADLQAAADLFTQDAMRAAGVDLAVSMPAASALHLAALLRCAAAALATPEIHTERA